MLSVNTNTGAMVALQYLNQTEAQMEKTQNAVNTGMKVASAKDDGATFAMAQNMRGDIAGVQKRLMTLSDGLRQISHELPPFPIAPRLRPITDRSGKVGEPQLVEPRRHHEAEPLLKSALARDPRDPVPQSHSRRARPHE